MHVGDHKWLMIDSCKEQRTGRNIALDYLRSIGVDIAKDIVMIVATHAHDDHFAGIADAFEQATAAKMVVSSALSREEFFVLMESDAVAASQYGLRRSAYSEYRRILQISERRFKSGDGGTIPMIKAMESRQLLQMPGSATAPPVDVWSLSPSDMSVQRAIAKFVTACPVADFPVRRSHLDPNDCSVVVRVRIGDIVILLGGDLPTGPAGCGWEAILASATHTPASVIKVPHHGSVTSHHDRMWDELLDEQPVALIAPFRAGRKRLPAKDDLERIVLKTPHVYLTARTDLPAKRRAVTATADRVASLAREVRDPWGDVGQVTARRKPAASEWTVWTRPPSYRIGHSVGRRR